MAEPEIPQREFRMVLRAPEDIAEDVVLQVREYIEEMWGDEVSIEESK